MKGWKNCLFQKIQAPREFHASFLWMPLSILEIVAFAYIYHQKQGRILFFYLLGVLNARTWYETPFYMLVMFFSLFHMTRDLYWDLNPVHPHLEGQQIPLKRRYDVLFKNEDDTSPWHVFFFLKETVGCIIICSLVISFGSIFSLANSLGSETWLLS